MRSIEFGDVALIQAHDGISNELLLVSTSQYKLHTLPWEIKYLTNVR